MKDETCTGVRVFISYSHEDQDAARRIATWLSHRGAKPIWDEQLQPGARFREELVTFIGNAHVFVALLTEASIKRPWVLQEMGYATALGIPMVPISAGPLPQGLIGDLHALRVGSDWLDLEQRLPAVKWLSLKDAQLREPNTVLATLARSSFDRVKLLVTFANRVLSLGGTGVLRQRAGLSTFSIPDAPVMHKVWIEHDGPTPRNSEHHEQQRQERRIFENQARTEGCKLIIDPDVPYADLKAKKGRLSRLREFLADPRSNYQIQAITHTREFSGNVTIFGDWWVAESLMPRAGGYRETTFSWHPGTVKRFSDEFDEEFAYLCEQQRVTPDKSRLLSIREIDRALAACG